MLNNCVRCGNRPLNQYYFQLNSLVTLIWLVIWVCNSRLGSRYGAWGQWSLKSKISSMSTIETRPFGPYSYILWNVLYGNTRHMYIILVANIIWRSGHAIRYSSFFLNFLSPPYIVAGVSSQFSMSQLCNMIVLAARLMGTLFGPQIVLSMHKKIGQGGLARRWGRLFLILKLPSMRSLIKEAWLSNKFSLPKTLENV